jgi:trehalose synthase
MSISFSTYDLSDQKQKIWRFLKEFVVPGRMGENDREHIRNNFLITRHLRECMLLFLSLLPGEHRTSLTGC